MERPIPIEELLTHAAWLRKLATSLVDDGTLAEDAVQETWLAALRRPPARASPPRRWLAHVLRNSVRNRRRSEARRGDHERFAPAEASPVAPDAIAAEAEAQRLLAEAVVELDEPLRAVIVLRYFRGLDSEAAGRELGVPAGTVRWRTSKALEELRARLCSADGRVVLPDLVAGIPFELEVRARDERVLAARTLLLGPAEWLELELPLDP